MHITRYPVGGTLNDDDCIFIAGETAGARRYKIKQLYDKMDNVESALLALSGSSSGGLSNLTNSLNQLRNTVSTLQSTLNNTVTVVNQNSSRISALEGTSGSGGGTTIGQANSVTPGIAKLFNTRSTATDGAYTASYINSQIDGVSNRLARELNATALTSTISLDETAKVVVNLASDNETRSFARNAPRIIARLRGNLIRQGLYHPFNFTAILDTDYITSSSVSSVPDSKHFKEECYGYLNNGMYRFEINVVLANYAIYLKVPKAYQYFWGGDRWGTQLPANAFQVRMDGTQVKLYV